MNGSILRSSIILLPVKYLTFFVLLGTLDSTVLRFDKTVPVSPFRVLYLHASLLIGVSLFKSNEFVEISQHIDKHTTVLFSFQKIIKSKLNATVRLEYIHHLTNNILEIEIYIALHIS